MKFMNMFRKRLIVTGKECWKWHFWIVTFFHLSCSFCFYIEHCNKLEPRYLWLQKKQYAILCKFFWIFFLKPKALFFCFPRQLFANARRCVPAAVARLPGGGSVRFHLWTSSSAKVKPAPSDTANAYASPRYSSASPSCLSERTSTAGRGHNLKTSSVAFRFCFGVSFRYVASRWGFLSWELREIRGGSGFCGWLWWLMSVFVAVFWLLFFMRDAPR